MPLYTQLEQRALHSLTVPNAKCPVCGMSVFFYQNSFSSQVFFDDLGPPWPKHPCTDNSHSRRDTRSIHAPQKQPANRADWLSSWRPFWIMRGEKDLILVQDAVLGTSTTYRLDRPFAGNELPMAYLQKRKGGGITISLIGATGAAETYHARAARKGRRTTLAGFKLYCQREREVCRRVDERNGLRKAYRLIRANLFSNTTRKWHSTSADVRIEIRGSLRAASQERHAPFRRQFTRNFAA